MNLIEQLKNRCEQKRREQRKAEIRANFYLCERDNRIYIMCGTTAISKVDPDASARFIASMLEQTRNEALEFEGLL